MLSRPPPLSKDMPLMLLKATQVEENRLSIAMKFRATAGKKKKRCSQPTRINVRSGLTLQQSGAFALEAMSRIS